MRTETVTMLPRIHVFVRISICTLTSPMSGRASGQSPLAKVRLDGPVSLLDHDLRLRERNQNTPNPKPNRHMPKVLTSYNVTKCGVRPKYSRTTTAPSTSAPNAIH